MPKSVPIDPSNNPSLYQLFYSGLTSNVCVTNQVAFTMLIELRHHCPSFFMYVIDTLKANNETMLLFHVWGILLPFSSVGPLLYPHDGPVDVVSLLPSHFFLL